MFAKINQKLVFYCIFHLFYILTTVPTPSCSFPSPLVLSSSTPPPFGKGLASVGVEKVRHIVLRQDRAPPCIKAGEGILTLRTGSKKPARAPGTDPDHTARSPTIRPKLYNCHPHAEGLGQFHEGSLTVGPESMSSQHLWSARHNFLMKKTAKEFGAMGSKRRCVSNLWLK